MNGFWTWSTWDLDMWTVGWLAWILFFAVWETLSSFSEDAEMLTNHLRPIFLSMPLTWFLTAGLWLWLGFHMLAPVLEDWIPRAAGGR